MNAPTFLRRSEIAGLLGDGPTVDTGPRIARPMRTAYIALGVFCGLFLLWSILAPLDSAAVANGILRADGGGRRVVQHLEGGIIREILVREGQMVRAGQPLVILDDTQSNAQDSALQSSYDALLAQDARLTAERTGAAAVSYPAELTSRMSDPAVRAIIAASDSVFRAKRQALAQQISILEQRIGQASADLGSTGAQAAALGDQGALIAQEAESVQALVNEGLERKSRLLALQRQAASIAGQRSQLGGNAARIRDIIAETHAQMAFLRGQQASEAAIQQRDVQASLAEAREKLTVSRDINKRRQVVAPVDGRVVNLRIVTKGGVLGPGQPVLDIVPTNEKIVIMAKLKANDIDVVNAGLEAEVRLTPYKARVMPLLKGTVRTISPDATYDEKTNNLYYETEILLDPAQMRQLKDVRLVSGMPAEVFIKLGSRSLLQYLTQPLVDSFHRAFREP
jgi:HlyD family secretion protein